MLSNTNRKDLAFVIWSIRELEDIKMLFSIIELHCEINQDIGNLHRASRVLGSNLRGKHYNVFLPLPYVNAVMSQNQHVEKFELSWRDKVGL